MKVRVRLAPSPTGYLHMGTARVALFNYLFAKQNKGSFILRIEDTDKERSKKEYEEDIIKSLLWLGLKWNEGPDYNDYSKYIGDYGPYRQSERVSLYKKYLEILLNKGLAYYCFCLPEELEAQKNYLISIGKPPVYSGKCRELKKEEVLKKLERGERHIIRLAVPKDKIIKFNDIVRGEIKINSSIIGDFSIAKGLEEPLYNFAVVVDDYEMEISHIIRGEDHISNTPKQIIIQQMLNFNKVYYAHLPLILAPDRTKLSKRHGAVSVMEFKKMGYLPESIINFLAFLGWNPGTDKEIYSLQELIKDFSLERIQKSGAIFNIKKLDFLNSYYIKQKSADELFDLSYEYIKDFIKQESDKDKIKKILEVYKTRINKLSDLPTEIDFFFKDINYHKDLLRWKDATDTEILLCIDKLEDTLDNIKEEDFNRDYLSQVLLKEAQEFAKIINRDEKDRGYMLWTLRVALTGKKFSAGPFEIMEILGKKETIRRLKKAGEIIQKKQ